MKNISIIILLILFLGCSVENIEKTMDIRFVIQSKNNMQTEGMVYLEGSDGNLVTGSNVIFKTSSNVSTLLSFNYTEGCYKGNIPPSADGVYSLEILSKLLNERKIQSVEHFKLSGSSDIIQLADTDGNNALAGDVINFNNDISIEWDEVENSNIYQLILLKDGAETYISTITGTSTILPAATISESGTYNIRIAAQYINGDPLFIDSNFYSYSEKIGASLLFSGEVQ